jgi:hypothetical protein
MWLLLLITVATINITETFNINRFCVNCKNYINSESKPETGKCLLFPKIEYNIEPSNIDMNKYEYLVTGKPFNNDTNYTECITARQLNNMCGEEGQYYREKNTGFKDSFAMKKLKKLEKYIPKKCIRLPSCE